MRSVEKIIVALLVLLAVTMPACTQLGNNPPEVDAGKIAGPQAGI